MLGAALVAALVGDGVSVLATARTPVAVARVREAGAEPLHTDVENLGAWRRELGAVDALFHLGLPRLRPPVRALGMRRRAAAARAAAEALAPLVDGRPLVMASSSLVYGDRPSSPARDGDPAAPLALAAPALAAERALAACEPRIVRFPWIYGEGGLARDVVAGLRERRYRIVGRGDNRWGLVSVRDAVRALLTAAGAPPGTYVAGEEEAPTQAEVVARLCGLPGLRHPDHVPPALATLSLGGPISAALAASVWVAPGRLAEEGWRADDHWREGLLSLARRLLEEPARRGARS